MSSLDIGIVGPVIPSVELAFHITSRESSWLYTFFVLAFMVGSPVMSKFSDFYGWRKIFTIEILLFGLGSALIAFASNIPLIFFGRIIQGVGAGGILPVAASFIGDQFSVERRGFALGLLGSIYGTSAACGPIVGAALIPYGWQWCFLINVPIAVFVILFGLYILPESKDDRKLNIDWLGIFVFSLTSILLAYGVNQIDSSNFISSLLSWSVLPYLIGFLIFVPVFLLVEKRAVESIVPIYMFKNKEILVASLLVICYGISYSITIFIPSLAILTLSLNDNLASLMLVPMVGVQIFAAPIMGHYLYHVGSRKIIALGMICLTVGSLFLGLYSNNMIIFLITGLPIGFGFITLTGAPMRYLVLTETSSNDHGAGQGIINMISSFGQIIGGALIGGLIASYNGSITGYNLTLILIMIIGILALILTTQLKTRNEQVETMNKNL